MCVFVRRFTGDMEPIHWRAAIVAQSFAVALNSVHLNYGDLLA
jgi:hypothetical protein